jgi:hypothetical protein
VVYVHDDFSYDVQEEQGKRTHSDEGAPLPAPEDVPLLVVVFYDQDPLTGTITERRFRFLPEHADTLREKVTGQGAVARATLLDLPAGVRA